MTRSAENYKVAACLGLALCGVAFALAVGSETVSRSRAFAMPASIDRLLLLSVRLPRVLLAVVIGAGLGVSGAALQALLRNALAEPYVLGVSGGAALAATIALLFGAGGAAVAMAPVTTLAAFAGGLFVTVTLLPLLRRFEGKSANVLLVGIVVNACASAFITFLKTVVSANKAQELLFWLTGFLDVPTWPALFVTAASVTLGALVLVTDARALETLGLGEASAHALGVSVRAVSARTLVACSLITAAVVAISGLIGFVGLLVPHGARLLKIRGTRATLVASAFLGMAVMAVCDGASRLLFRQVHTEIPVGALTAMIGGPLFLVLLLRRGPQA